MAKETLLSMVEDGTVELVNSKEVQSLRKKTQNAVDELERYKTRLSEFNDGVYECSCESPLPACTYIHTVDPDRSPRTPNFCPLDGKGCRWKPVKKKKVSTHHGE